MASREELQFKLESIMGNRNVYFQPPASISLSYPAIVYSLDDIRTIYADNKKYERFKCYQITLIEKSPVSNVLDNLLDLDYCSFSRKYTADNLYHTILKIFW